MCRGRCQRLFEFDRILEKWCNLVNFYLKIQVKIPMFIATTTEEAATVTRCISIAVTQLLGGMGTCPPPHPPICFRFIGIGAPRIKGPRKVTPNKGPIETSGPYRQGPGSYRERTLWTRGHYRQGRHNRKEFIQRRGIYSKGLL